MISLNDVVLLLRGWAEDKSPLRVVVTSPEVNFTSRCTVWDATGERVSLWIGPERDKNAVAFALSNLRFEFGDVPVAEADLPIGGTVESGIVGVRGDFSITIMLLKS
jgi:hypothetical protein